MINQNAVFLLKKVAENKNVTKHRKQLRYMIKISITLKMHALSSMIKSRGGYRKFRERVLKF